MTTLHAYILREMLKTFGLAIVALTLVFTLAGGLYNVIRFEGVTSADFVRFIPMLIPVVVTLTMPLAALFAATMTYGRLAADNEFQACRAAGINVHRLFLAAALLALFVAGFTLWVGNYIIPAFLVQLDQFARANLRDFAAQQLQRKGFVRYVQKEKYFLTARQVGGFDLDELRRNGFPTDSVDYLRIEEPTYLQLDENDKIVRFTTARQGLVQFDRRSSPVKITLVVRDARDYTVRRQTVEFGQQQIGPLDAPFPIPEKYSWAQLDRLFYWRQNPWDGPRVRDAVQKFAADVGKMNLVDRIGAALAGRESIDLEEAGGRRFRISAAAIGPDPRGLALTEPTIEYFTGRDDRPIRYRAGRGTLAVRPMPEQQLLVDIRLDTTPQRAVQEFNPRSSDTRPREKATLNLDPLQVPVAPEVTALSAGDLLDPGRPLPVRASLEDERAGLRRSAAEFRRKVNAVIHFRLGFASSALVTILMGAALGVIFRGARALAAFGLGCVPMGTIAILMFMGRQLGENERTAQIGPMIIWGGLTAGLLADFILIRLGVRR